MQNIDTFYIGGEWVAPAPGAGTHAIVDPSTEQAIGQVAMGTAQDVDRAVSAARAAFTEWSQTTREDRLVLLNRLAEIYQRRLPEMAAAITLEMGAPTWLATQYQAGIGLVQIRQAIAALRDFEFEGTAGKTRVLREPIGVAALITAWNWPADLVWGKVAAALAAGCTMVLKPSELAALDARLAAEILHEAGVPAGVFNMLFGDGKVVGAALSRHPEVDMVSITGSTRAGAEVAMDAAPTIKRVVQELGGKSASVILDDAELKGAVSATVINCMLNSGQTCVAPTRMLVPRSLYPAAVTVATTTANGLLVGPPRDPGSKLGPLASRAQFERVQTLIACGSEEGARVVAGGTGRPEGLEQGFYVRPTVFAGVRNDMRIAREEIFGPVIAVIPYEDEEDAIAIANDSAYGLAAYVWSGDVERARRVARRLRVGSVRINGAPMDFAAPFGGYKASGNGREHGAHGLAEFLETKSLMG